VESDLTRRFADTWGAMGSFWGVNPSVARVHGLLIISERPWCLDEISEHLGLSRGNVSTCLKELRTWKVVRKVLQPGDRREFYVCEPDSWQMLFSIVRERKRREFDPLLESVRDALREAEAHPQGVAVARMRQMEQMLGTLDRLAGRALASGEQAKALISFILGRK
jgi:DNA-binding transcriptional regulator GbsR (MarR family)